MAYDTKVWRCGKYTLTFDRPRIMGVLNVTPDSFSDGGEHFDTDAAIAHGLAMLDAGADIIDVGGESTRPGFRPVNADEEARRVLPVVRALAAKGAIVSIDTRHVEVAKAAVRVGASIVNDVTGFTDPKMVEFVAKNTCGANYIVPQDNANRCDTRWFMLGDSERWKIQVKGLQPLCFRIPEPMTATLIPFFSLISGMEICPLSRS